MGVETRTLIPPIKHTQAARKIRYSDFMPKAQIKARPTTFDDHDQIENKATWPGMGYHTFIPDNYLYTGLYPTTNYFPTQ